MNRTDPPDVNGNMEDNVRALVWTVFGDSRNPDIGLIARMARIEARLESLITAVNRASIGFGVGTLSIIATIVVKG